MQKMVEPVLTPAHPDPFETLLDEPFARTLDHATPQRQPKVLVDLIGNMIAVACQIGIHRRQSFPCGVGQALYLQSLGKVSQDPLRLAMAQAVACPPEPPTRLRSPSIEPGGRALPQVLRGVVKVQDARGITRKLLFKQAP